MNPIVSNKAPTEQAGYSRGGVTLTAAWGFFMLLSSFANGADTCLEYYPQEMLVGSPSGDEILWDFLDSPYYTPYQRRAQLSAEYGIEKDDWDGGWGWATLDEVRPYIHELPRMMNAADLLVFGLDDRLRLQGTWSADPIGSGFGRPAVLSRGPQVIDVVGRGNYDRILHVQLWAGDEPWVPGRPAPESSDQLIELPEKGPDGYVPIGDVSLVSRSDDTLDAFVRSSGRVLAHLTWTDGAGWSVTIPTENVVRPSGSRYFIDTDPVGLVDSGGTIHVFTIDSQSFTYDRLIHYFLAPGQTWQAEDVSETIGYNESLEGPPVVVNRSGGLLDVFVRTSGGNLLRHARQTNGSWTVDELAPTGFAEYGLSQPAAISRTVDSLDVFVVHTASGDLIHFYWTQDTGWNLQNLGDLSGAAAVEGAPAVVVRDDGVVHVFAKEYSWGHLAQFFWIPGTGWAFQDISLATGFALRLAPDLAAAGDSRRIDVLGRGPFGALIHYYWTPEQSWLAENASASPTMSYVYDRTDTPPVLVRRTEYALELLGHREPVGYRYFSSAIGPTVSSWHTNLEYWRWTRGPLHQFRYVPEVVFDGGDLPPPLEDVGAAAKAERGAVVGIGDTVTMYCGSFPITPAARAGIMVHESTHMNFRVDHDENPDVEDDCEEPCWDHWYPHDYRDPDFPLSGGIGASFWQGYSYEPTHSAYQADIEYLCDISQFAIPAIAQEPTGPSPWMPGDIYAGAAALAQTVMAEHILDPPQWTCGVPRPLP